jgi:hypothetical protein
MLTDEQTPVNAVNATPRSVMLSIAQLATRDGVSKAAVSRKVKQLIGRQGLAVERDEQGRVAAVNSVQYDLLRGRVDDPSKAQAPQRSEPARIADAPSIVDNESYNEALRLKTWQDFERARFNLAKDKREYVRAAGVADAAVACGADIARIVDRLPAAADELAAAAGREGVHGVRVALKKLAARMRTEIAHTLATLAAAAPETEDDGEVLQAAGDA